MNPLVGIFLHFDNYVSQHFLTIFTARNPFVRNFTKNSDSQNLTEFPLDLRTHPVNEKKEKKC